MSFSLAFAGPAGQEVTCCGVRSWMRCVITSANGTVYQRNANFNTTALFGLDGITPVPMRIGPFFFKATDDNDDED